MTFNYTHSELFGRLKKTSESIQKNLTSFQYLSVLDDMLYNAVAQLVTHTSFMEGYMAQVLAWQIQHPKRKASGVSKDELSSRLTLFLLVDSPEAKIRILRKLALDRAILFTGLSRWLKTADPIRELAKKPTSESALKQAELSELCNIRSGHYLYPTFNQTLYWYEEACKFKMKIIEKYIRLCLSTAKRDYVELGHRVELNDIIQTYLFTVNKAIDKCNSSKGVLTTHVQNWLMSAKTTVASSSMMGTVNSRTRANSTYTETVSIDDLTHELTEKTVDENDVRDREDTIEEIKLVAKQFDTSGLGRLSLGIREVLSTDDRRRLRDMALKKV